MLEYDLVDVYLRDDVNQGAWTSAQQKLMKWFSDEMTDDVFLELIKMKEFENSNGKKATKDRLERFKEFMSNYYMDSENLTEESFQIVVKYAQEQDEFRYKTDAILRSPFLTPEIFEYALDAKFLGTDRYKWYNVFTTNQYSETIQEKFIKFTAGDRAGWTQFLKNQKISSNIINKMLELTKFKQDIIIEIAQYNHKVDEKTFMEMLQNLDLNDTYSLTGERDLVIAVKKMILKDRNFYEEPHKWEIIYNIISKLNSEYQAIVYSAILTYPDVSDDIMDTLCSNDTVLGYLNRDFDINKIDSSNRITIFNKSGHEDFLPQKTKDLFLF